MKMIECKKLVSAHLNTTDTEAPRTDPMPAAPSGLELTFYSGVYGTCIGAMMSFGQDAKSLIGISGICIGVGEILGESSSFR